MVIFALTELPCIYCIIMLLILILLELNIFQKKSKSLLMDLLLQKIFIEYKYMIQ